MLANNGSYNLLNTSKDKKIEKNKKNKTKNQNNLELFSIMCLYYYFFSSSTL